MSFGACGLTPKSVPDEGISAWMGSDSVHAGLPPNRSQTRGLVYGWVRFGAGGVIPKSATDEGAESRTGKGRAPPAGRTQQHYDVFSYNDMVLSFFFGVTRCQLSRDVWRSGMLLQ